MSDLPAIIAPYIIPAGIIFGVITLDLVQGNDRECAGFLSPLANR